MTGPPEAPSGGGGSGRRWPAVLAVGLPLLTYATVVARGYDGRTYLRGDAAYYYLTAVSILADGDLDLSNQLPGEPARHSLDVALDVHGRLVPKHPILMPLASLPLVGLLGPPGALAFNLLQLGLLAALLYALARRVAVPWAAGLATAATGAATVLPHYAWNYSPDVFSTVLLVSAAVVLIPRRGPAVPERLLAAGVLLGLALASKLPLLVTVPFFFLLVPRPLGRSAVPFLAGLALPLLLFAAYNTHLFGAPWVTSYDRMAMWTGEGFETRSQRGDFGDPVSAGLFRQIMDRNHGLLPTSPLTLVALAGLPWLWRRRAHLAAMVGGSTVALLLLFSSYRLWNHSHYGNRFLLPVVALAVLPLAPALEAAAAALARWWRKPRLWRPSRATLAFTLLVVLQLVPLWATPYLPTQDGPAHLANASLLLDLHRPDRAFLREHYQLEPRAGSTWAGHLALAGLLSFFPPLAAEKLFLSAYLVSLPLAVRFALRRLRPGAEDLAFLALPFSASYLYHMGFQSFLWSLVLFCLLLGYLLGRDGELGRWRERLAFGGLGLLLWLAHPVTLVAAVVAAAAAGAWGALGRHQETAQPGSAPGARQRLWRRCGVPLLALAPAAALLTAFAVQQPASPPRWLPLGQRLGSLATLDVLASFERRELWFSGGFAALLVIASSLALWTRFRSGRSARADAALLAALGLLLLYLAAPDALAGGGWISHRMMLLMALTLILWLGAQPMGRAFERACQVGPALVALGLMALHGARYADIAAYLEEYVELGLATPTGSALLPVTLVPWGVSTEGRLLSTRVQPFANAAGYVAAESESAVVLLDNYQAAKGHFPVRYREGLGALAAGGPQAIRPPLRDLLGHLERSGAPADVALWWGSAEPGPRRPGAAALLEQIQASYLPVARSQPRGLGHLYVSAALFGRAGEALPRPPPGAGDG